MEESTLITWGGWIAAGLLSLIGVLARRVVMKHDAEIEIIHRKLDKVSDLEKLILRDYATRETVHQLRNDMQVGFTQIHERIDANDKSAASRHDAIINLLMQRGFSS